jgi:L-threonylcarbamoyladenylate synthase
MNDFSNDINSSLKVLLQGGIILYPTDTIWGIGCDATNGNAIKKIYRLKKRHEKKSMIILVANEKEINNYVKDPSGSILEYIAQQKTPTTAIFQRAVNLPHELINEDGSIAIRIVKDDFCQQLILRLCGALVSTSANISGEQSPNNFGSINAKIKSGVDYIVQHRREEMNPHLPSSIVKLNSQNEIEKIR